MVLRALLALVATGWCLAGQVHGAPVTVQFAGHIQGTSGISVRAGALVRGFFTYDPSSVSGQQSADYPILVIDIREAFLLEVNSFAIGIYNNWSPIEGGPEQDVLLLNFTHPLLASGNGGLWFSSTNTALFSSETLPATFPSLDLFDLSRSLTLFYDFGQTYWTVATRIDQASQVSGAGGAEPAIYGLYRVANTLRFRFEAEPTFRYTVEFTDSVASGAWTGLTNVTAKIQGFTTVVSDITTNAQRYYRIRKEPCFCR